MDQVINILCDWIRSAETLDELEGIWSGAGHKMQRNGEVRAAYDYRKACLSETIAEYLGAG